MLAEVQILEPSVPGIIVLRITGQCVRVVEVEIGVSEAQRLSEGLAKIVEEECVFREVEVEVEDESAGG